jgi:hypothetical protein
MGPSVRDPFLSLVIVNLSGSLEYLFIRQDANFPGVCVFTNIYTHGCAQVKVKPRSLTMVIELVRPGWPFIKEYDVSRETFATPSGVRMVASPDRMMNNSSDAR